MVAKLGMLDRVALEVVNHAANYPLTVIVVRPVSHPLPLHVFLDVIVMSLHLLLLIDTASPYRRPRVSSGASDV